MSREEIFSLELMNLPCLRKAFIVTACQWNGSFGDFIGDVVFCHLS